VTPVLDSVAIGSEELRFEAALKAVGVYQRARLIRRLAVLVTITIAATRLVLLAFCVPVGEGTIPALVGISLLTSLLSIDLEWSTRALCKDSLDDFYECVRREKASQ
jgi:hypothetical protein